MAIDENYARLIGNAGGEPKIHQTKSGEHIGKLSVCTSDRWIDKSTGQWKQKPEWHKVTVFDPVSMQKTVPRITKGSRVLVEGKIVTQRWTDQQGVERFTTGVHVTKFRGRVLLIDWPRSEGDGQQYQNNGNGYPQGGNDERIQEMNDVQQRYRDNQAAEGDSSGDDTYDPDEEDINW